MFSLDKNILYIILVSILVVGFQFTVLQYKPQDTTVWIDLQGQILTDNTILIFEFNIKDDEQTYILSNFNKLIILSTTKDYIKQKINEYEIKFLSTNLEELTKFLKNYQLLDFKQIKSKVYICEFELKK